MAEHPPLRSLREPLARARLGFGIAGTGGLPMLSPVIAAIAFLSGALIGALLVKSSLVAPLLLAALVTLVSLIVSRRSYQAPTEVVYKSHTTAQVKPGNEPRRDGR